MMSTLLLAGYAGCAFAAPSSQETFKSPEEASAALFAAVRDQDEQSLARILGAESELFSSGDAAYDKADQERFVQKYQEMHRLARETHDDRLLYIGAENWPFPVPLTERNGAWRFNPDAGREEIRFRLIGENEVTAIELCHTLLAAAKSGDTDAPEGLTAKVLAATKDDGQSVAFHGYRVRALPTQGGLGFIAYPVAYRISGVMTFVIDPGDSVRQKDLGPNTAQVASAITDTEVDATWIAAELASQGSRGSAAP